MATHYGLAPLVIPLIMAGAAVLSAGGGVTSSLISKRGQRKAVDAEAARQAEALRAQQLFQQQQLAAQRQMQMRELAAEDAKRRQLQVYAGLGAATVVTFGGLLLVANRKRR